MGEGRPRGAEKFHEAHHEDAPAVEQREFARFMHEQAIIATAASRLNREFASARDHTSILSRFCRLITEMLGCEVSQIWLWQPAEQVYVAAASHGYSPEETEHLQTLQLPADPVDDWFSPSVEHDVGYFTFHRHAASSSVRPDGIGLSARPLLYMRLRVGQEKLGILWAGQPPQRCFSESQLRIARGIHPVASISISHARLVDELARVNRLKSDFVATMSHELRTPMNTLLGYTDLLAAEVFGPVTEDQLSVLDRMDRSARELLDLINATLDLSRIETRRVAVELEDVGLTGLLEELETETRYLRAPRGLQFDWQITPDCARLRTDRMKLKVILKNLLTNGIKFTESGGVRIEARPRDSGIEINVCDTGIGIAPDVLPIIFDPFRQGESAITRRHGGVGLGLYVVRRLLDLLNGSIQVQSKVGSGSTFQIWVPSETEGQIV